MKALKRLLYKLVPRWLYVLLKEQVSRLRKRRFKRLPKLSETQFRDLLENNFGIKQGAVVFVHSSINKLNLDFSVIQLFSILQDVVGPKGTLLFPATHIDGSVYDYLRSDAVFDVRKSPSKMGLLSEMARRKLRKNEGVFRSLHPTNSVIAMGKYAKELTAEHHLFSYPCGEKSPYFKITQYNGIIIGLGATTDNLSFVHCVEDINPETFPVKTRRDALFSSMVVDEMGNKIAVKTRVAHPDIFYRDVEKYIKKHIPSDICRDFTLHGMPFFSANSVALYKEMEKHFKQNITIYSKKIYKK